MELIASTVVAIAIGAVSSGFSWSGALFGALSFVGVLLIAFIVHLLLAPRDLDKQNIDTIGSLRVELNNAKAQIEQHDLAKKEWSNTAKNYENEIKSQQQQKELAETRAMQYETERNELTVRLKDQASIHKVEVRSLQDTMEKHYREFHDKLIAHLNEISSLKGQLITQRSKNAKPQIYGKIKELFPKYSSDGLFVTLRALIGNKGAATTIQPFTLKCSMDGGEYEGRLEDGVKDYCIHRRIEKPLWPSMTREEEYEPLTDLSADNLKPLQRHDFREGWLQFRFPNITYERPNTKFVLELRDAADTVYLIEIEPPFPLSGRVRLTKNLEAEWEEETERSKRQETEESDQEK